MCDYDSYPTVQSRKTVTARKAHRCEECSSDIPVGTSYLRVKQLLEGRWEVYTICLVCEWMTDQEDNSPFHACYGSGEASEWEVQYSVLNQDNAWWQEVRDAMDQIRPPDARRVNTGCANEDCCEPCASPVWVPGMGWCCARCAVQDAPAVIA